jgi:hypothetical protein
MALNCQRSLLSVGDKERRIKTTRFNLLQTGKLLKPTCPGLLRCEEGHLDVKMRIECQDGIVN